MTDRDERVGRLVDAGVEGVLGVPSGSLATWAAALPDRAGVLALAPSLTAVGPLAGLLRRGEQPGFVVTDMTDVDAFTPVEGTEPPEAPLYLLEDVRRGDELRGWSPDEALPHLAGQGRSPLTLHEGLSWLLQEPEQLEPGACFMTIGSRLRRPDGRLDARTPALWISGGTGRDGRDRRGAPKVGWCWAGNRHDWLGFGSTARRTAPDTA